MDRAGILFDGNTAVSNIPFNTIASVLNTAGVQRQQAATAAKRTQDEQRTGQVFKAETERHAQQVEDPGDTNIDRIGDEPDKHNDQQKKKHAKHEQEQEREVIDIAVISAEGAQAAANAKSQARVGEQGPKSSLDISA